MKKLIFIDLDGVMVDLERGLLEKRGYTFPLNRTLETKKQIDDMWDDISKDKTFWVNLPPMPHYEEVYNKILTICPSPIILSATPECYDHDERHEECKMQKIAWVHKNLGADQAFRVIITKSKLKQNYMNIEPNDMAILVDDHPGNIKRWNQAGGYGIFHDTPENALKELDKL